MEFTIWLEDGVNIVDFIKTFRGARLNNINVLGKYREYKTTIQLKTLKSRLAKLGNCYSMSGNQVIIKSY